MNIRMTGVLVAAALCAGAVSGGARAESLEEALALAYRNNPSLNAARAGLRATRERIELAWAQVLPRFDLSANAYDWERVRRTGGEQDRRRSRLFDRLGVRQSLRVGLDSIPGIRAAEFVVEAEEAQLAAVEQTTLLGAATAYADVIRDQAVLGLNVSNERVLERQLEATRDRFDVGEVTRTDVSQAESRLSRARAERIAAEGRLIQARAAYANAVGMSPGTLSQPSPLSDLPATLDDALTRARESNFGVVAGRARVRAARKQVEQVERESWPSLSLNSELSYDDNFQGGSDRRRGSVTLGLTVPLYTAGSIRSRAREARHVVAQELERTRQSVQTAVETATGTWQRLQVARAQIAAFAALVRASEIALAGVREEAEVGSRTVLDVLDAEQELLDARVNLLRARRDEIVSTVDLRRAVGSLTAARLGLPVE